MRGWVGVEGFMEELGVRLLRVRVLAGLAASGLARASSRLGLGLEGGSGGVAFRLRELVREAGELGLLLSIASSGGRDAAGAVAARAALAAEDLASAAEAALEALESGDTGVLERLAWLLLRETERLDALVYATAVAYSDTGSGEGEAEGVGVVEAPG